MASKGYPENYKSGHTIKGIDKIRRIKDGHIIVNNVVLGWRKAKRISF